MIRRKFTGEWKRIGREWFQKVISTHWLKFITIPCIICKREFRTRRHGVISCGKKCAAKHRWKKRTTPEQRRTSTGEYIHNGYRMIYVPEATSRVYEHRYNAQKKIGRKLLQKEMVHHLDGDRLNNSPSNLIIITKADHNILHKVDEAAKRKRGQKGQFK